MEITDFANEKYDKAMLRHLQDSLKISHGLTDSVAFIENKPIDYQLLHQILALSQKENHWANFGPVSMLLESLLKEKMEVVEEKSVVVCKSGTQALHTLIRLHEKKAGGSMRWVVSAFGFIASNIGPLASAQIVDCDNRGMLSLEELKKLEINSWDGVVVTNLFGMCEDITEYRDFCLEHGKVLIIDAATAFLTPSRKISQAPDEAVSFHQTKPWGMGEGGCAVVNSIDAEEFRALLNYGNRIESIPRKYAVNGKISDFCSALILQRIMGMPGWQPLYNEQARRIHKIARESGLQPLLEKIKDYMVMPHIPVLAEFEIRKEGLNNQYFTMRKYYRPLNSGYTQASDIFRRIVNIPCHKDMSIVADQCISTVLGRLGRSPANYHA